MCQPCVPSLTGKQQAAVDPTEGSAVGPTTWTPGASQESSTLVGGPDARGSSERAPSLFEAIWAQCPSGRKLSQQIPLGIPSDSITFAWRFHSSRCRFRDFSPRPSRGAGMHSERAERVPSLLPPRSITFGSSIFGFAISFLMQLATFILSVPFFAELLCDPFFLAAFVGV